MKLRCNSCAMEREESQYYPRHKVCKVCLSARKKLRYQMNKDKISEANRIAYQRDPEKFQRKNRAYRKNNWEKLSVKKKEWKYANKERLLEQSRQRRKVKREKVNTYFRERNKDPLNKLAACMRSRTSQLVRKMSGGSGQKDHLKEYLGCALEELKIYLESKFQPGMTWNNYGRYGWHIDHIIPLSSAKNQEELYKLCYYTNLQPLWAEENIAKGNRLPYA